MTRIVSLDINLYNSKEFLFVNEYSKENDQGFKLQSFLVTLNHPIHPFAIVENIKNGYAGT